MRVEELRAGSGIRPLEYPLRETPHATIETNRTCNIQCRLCYTLERSHIKTLAAIEREIDLALEKRSLQTITLLGGEPTLHPRLPEIVASIKRRNLVCQILTNGVVFLEDDRDRLLDRLVEAGVDRILLHVDSGQSHVHQDLDEVRTRLFQKMERKKVHFSLSLTIYEEERGLMSGLIRKYSRFRYFDGILAVLVKDPNTPLAQPVGLTEEHASLERDLGILPSAYIPSSARDGRISWLVYQYFVDALTGQVLAMSPAAHRLIRKIYRILRGRQLFSIIVKPSRQRRSFFFIGLLEAFIDPRRIGRIVGMIRSSRLGEEARFQFIVIQTPPSFDPENNRYLICYHCPDATIRNGMLTPVCIADFINPLNGPLPEGELSKELYQLAYSHLGEI
ncbi:MAG: radical SAM protein [Candidatus Aminicenantes bacterium]|nr:radical SAM protein [Candidatus Aminicenantes bacterium]